MKTIDGGLGKGDEKKKSGADRFGLRHVGLGFLRTAPAVVDIFLLHFRTN